MSNPSAPKKIAMIGAGSRRVLQDAHQPTSSRRPALRDSEFALMSPTETKLRRMEAFVGADDQGQRLPRQGLGDDRPPRGDRRRRLRRRDDPGRRLRCVRHRLRGPAEVRRRPVHRRHARPRRHLPRPAAHPRPGRHRPRHGRSRQARRDHAPVRQPDGRQLPGARPREHACRSSASVTACRPRSTSSPATAASRTRTRSPTPAAASTTWTGSSASSTRAATCIPNCARSSRSPSTTRTKRCAARSSASSATS